MKKNTEIVFEDESFKFILQQERISHIDNADDFFKVFHEAIEIKYFIEGSSTLHIGNESVITEPGDVVVINPYEFHSTVNYSEEKGKYHLLMIGLDFFDENTQMDLRYLFMKKRFRIKTLIRNSSRINGIIEHIVEEMKGGKDYHRTVVKALMLELFCILLRDFKDDELAEYPSDKSLKYYEIIYPAIKMIRQNCVANYTLDELASACGVSKCHFCRIFKDSTSMSAIDYRNEYRLQIARVLVKTTNKSLSGIAVRCGFDDTAYFSRRYKMKFGHPPIKERAILSK